MRKRLTCCAATLGMLLVYLTFVVYAVTDTWADFGENMVLRFTVENARSSTYIWKSEGLNRTLSLEDDVLAVYKTSSPDDGRLQTLPLGTRQDNDMLLIVISAVDNTVSVWFLPKDSQAIELGQLEKVFPDAYLKQPLADERAIVVPTSLIAFAYVNHLFELDELTTTAVTTTEKPSPEQTTTSAASSDSETEGTSARETTSDEDQSSFKVLPNFFRYVVLIIAIGVIVFLASFYGARLGSRRAPQKETEDYPPPKAIEKKDDQPTKPNFFLEEIPVVHATDETETPIASEHEVKSDPAEKKAEKVADDSISLEQLVVLAYTNADAKERILANKSTRVSVSNYIQVSNRIQRTPKFCDDANGFYCLLDNRLLFPHPHMFNGYFTPNLLQGTILLEHCFTFDGDKAQARGVTSLKPAMVRQLSDGQYELSDKGEICLRG